jgi:GT2 family glycosyltransferase
MDVITSIITVNFHQPDVTIELLKSIAKSYSPKEVEVIVVDNGAVEDLAHVFHQYFSNIKYIRSEQNLGFAGGNNLGIAHAIGEYIFLLNNDTEIPKGCIEAMVEVMNDNPKIGLLSPLLLYFDDKTLVQYAGFTPMDYLTGRNEYENQFDKNVGQFNDVTRSTGYCHGAAVMCRKADLDKAGLMDENYFLYYEELDWCEKFKRIGKEIWFTGRTYVYHKESISVGKTNGLKTYFNTRNRMLFIRKNTGWLNTILFSIYYTLIAIPKAMVKDVMKNETFLIKWRLKALWWNYTHSKNSTNLGFKIR